MAEPKGLQKLLDGNQRFISSQFIYPHHDMARRTEVVSGQAPFAVILTCSDSRLAPEIIFNQGIGDIFVVRTAGNIVDDMVSGSIEYAVEHLNVPLILVLGHQKCGAVNAAAHGGEAIGHIKDVIDEIIPAVNEAKKKSGDLTSNAIDINIRNVVEKLKEMKPIISEFYESGKLEIIGSRYDLDTGRVVVLE